MPDLFSLNNARTTFQRVLDAKFFNGWVKHITPRTITVYTCTDSRMEPGDTFSFQVYGNGNDAFLRATITEVHGVDPGPLFSKKRFSGYSVEMTCEIRGGMTFQESRGQPRFFVSGFVAEVCEELCTVIDIGPAGFSVVSERAFAKGELLTITVKTLTHVAQCGVEVRNCITYPLDKHYHRIGVQIVSMGRIDAQKWKELYATTLEGSRMGGQVAAVDNDLNWRSKRPA